MEPRQQLILSAVLAVLLGAVLLWWLWPWLFGMLARRDRPPGFPLASRVASHVHRCFCRARPVAGHIDAVVCAVVSRLTPDFISGVHARYFNGLVGTTGLRITCG